MQIRKPSEPPPMHRILSSAMTQTPAEPSRVSEATRAPNTKEEPLTLAATHPRSREPVGASACVFQQLQSTDIAPTVKTEPNGAKIEPKDELALKDASKDEPEVIVLDNDDNVPTAAKEGPALHPASRSKENEVIVLVTDDEDAGSDDTEIVKRPARRSSRSTRAEAAALHAYEAPVQPAPSEDGDRMKTSLENFLRVISSSAHNEDNFSGLLRTACQTYERAERNDVNDQTPASHDLSHTLASDKERQVRTAAVPWDTGVWNDTISDRGDIDSKPFTRRARQMHPKLSTERSPDGMPSTERGEDRLVRRSQAAAGKDLCADPSSVQGRQHSRFRPRTLLTSSDDEAQTTPSASPTANTGPEHGVDSDGNDVAAQLVTLCREQEHLRTLPAKSLRGDRGERCVPCRIPCRPHVSAQEVLRTKSSNRREKPRSHSPPSKLLQNNDDEDQITPTGDLAAGVITPRSYSSRRNPLPRSDNEDKITPAGDPTEFTHIDPRALSDDADGKVQRPYRAEERKRLEISRRKYWRPESRLVKNGKRKRRERDVPSQDRRQEGINAVTSGHADATESRVNRAFVGAESDVDPEDIELRPGRCAAPTTSRIESKKTQEREIRAQRRAAGDDVHWSLKPDRKPIVKQRNENVIIKVRETRGTTQYVFVRHRKQRFRDVREELQLLAGNGKFKFELRYKDRIVKDNDTAKSLGILNTARLRAHRRMRLDDDSSDDVTEVERQRRRTHFLRVTVQDEKGKKHDFQHEQKAKFGSMFRAFARLCKNDVRSFRFFFDGKRLSHDEKPEGCEDFTDGSLIDAFFEAQGGRNVLYHSLDRSLHIFT